MDQRTLLPLPWLPVLETGNPAIDRQHQELIDDANTVQALVVREGAWTELVAAIGKMHRDCAIHFADESKLLAASNYADAAEHALEHQRILGEIGQIHGIVRSAPTPTRYHWELALTVRSLLVDHFLRYDLRYKSHLMYMAPYGP
jgi:hemerythrin-like metal-binding protein